MSPESKGSAWYQLTRPSLLQSIKILLARSPAHIHSIVVEYRKNSPTSLSKAVKQVFIGPLVKMLLFAIENSKNDKDGPGVCG